MNIDDLRKEWEGVNIPNPVKDVEWASLEHEDGKYRSTCPECKVGLLLIYRDPNTMELLELDRCILCGQQFRYTDIDKLNGR